MLGILAPIWTAKPETARRVRQRIRTVAQVGAWRMSYVEAQCRPATCIDGALPAMRRFKAHHRALPYAEIPAALETIDASPAGLAARACMRFLILTAARSGEARGALWDEVDMDAATWTIPGERMKGGRQHVVPLSVAALAVLHEAAALRDDSGLIFPSPRKRGRPLSDMGLTKCLRDCGLADRATVHGMRSAFRDWASERTNAPHAVMERALAHAVADAVEAAYSRSNLLERRRALMAEWGSFVTGTAGAEVIQLHA